ncbi:hypothetical protein [Microcystis sp. M42BS1]|uniref:hypothetical protein n=1 Tax=Microcystis sp. M42BS1 TaxID=2771192 RepID=UPI002585ECBD|nr:hypothetical protein [Microcystis sp. M42BS1]MCA2570648.1 hypothetical protein [Microcystis sp. M42BS1]
MSYNLIEIHWEDAATTHGWEEESEIDYEPPIVITVGFLIKETDKAYVVASTVGGDKTSNSRIIIPKGMVRFSKMLKFRQTKLK